MRPVIAIVGRPNVGKSTLLNRLAGRRVAVVEDQPGVTRDRLFVECRLGNREVVLVDTGGLDPDPGDALARAVVEQAHLAVEEADLVLFVCDGRDGIHPHDHRIADVLRRSHKPFVCLANKIDPGADRETWEFGELGLDALAISAAHSSGLDELVEQIDRRLAEAGLASPGTEEATAPAGEERLRLCLLGRPNVGKSSLANRLLGRQHQLVSEIAGTTRDAVDLAFESAGERFVLVDTPGVRRRGRISQKVERYGVVAALRSLERTDVAVVVLDGGEPFSDQDARLLGLAVDRGRCLVVALNKIDLLGTEAERRTYHERLAHGMRFVEWAPVVPLSARTGQGIERLLPAVRSAWQAAGTRLGTGDLNRLLEQAFERQPPPVVKGRRGRIYYATQTGIRPPTFVAWTNDPSRFPEHYRRYLERQLRSRYAFVGAPLRLVLRPRGKGRKRGADRSGGNG